MRSSRFVGQSVVSVSGTQVVFVTSGVRVGTPAVTSRGLGREEMEQIAKWIRVAFDAVHDEQRLAQVRKDVMALAKRFPLYPEWA